jgi:hypothetical protein
MSHRQLDICMRLDRKRRGSEHRLTADCEEGLHAIMDRPRGSTQYVAEGFNRKGIGAGSICRVRGRGGSTLISSACSTGGSRRRERMRCHAGGR